MIGKIVLNQIQGVINSKLPAVLEEVEKYKAQNPPQEHERGASALIDIDTIDGEPWILIKLVYLDKKTLTVTRVSGNYKFKMSEAMQHLSNINSNESNQKG